MHGCTFCVVALRFDFNCVLFIYLFFHVRCGHCKRLAPEYEKLAASFKKTKSLLIAKVSYVPQPLVLLSLIILHIMLCGRIRYESYYYPRFKNHICLITGTSHVRRWIVMNIKAFAVNMESLVTLQFSGFLRDL